MWVIGKEYRFEAAHHLPNHNGKCRRPHGHSYRVLVELEGLPTVFEGALDEGMVLDFNSLDAQMLPLLDLLDHQDLNTARGKVDALLVPQPPTAENITSLFVTELSKVFPPRSAPLHYPDGRTAPQLRRVRVYEGSKAYAEWRVK